MISWEYLIISGASDMQIVGAGLDGWELVSVVMIEHEREGINERVTWTVPTFYFKRPKK